MIRNKKFAIAVVLILVFTFVLAACGSSPPPASEPPQTAPPATTPPADTGGGGGVQLADYSRDGTSVLDGDPESQGAPQSPEPIIVPVPAGFEDKQWDLKANEQGFPDMPMLKFERDAFEHIRVRTNGQVDITLYDSSTLVPFEAQFASVSQGTCDITIYLANFQEGTQPIADMFQMPTATETWDTKTMTKIYRNFVFSNDVFRQENDKANVEWISIWAFAPAILETTNKPVRTVEDMKGLSLISSNLHIPYLQEMGATGVVQGIADYYTSLEKGVTDGIITHIPITHEFGMTDVLKYHTFLAPDSDHAGVGSQIQGFLANQTVWNSIPPEYQAVIKEELFWAADAQAFNNDNMIQTGIKYMNERGNELIRLSDAEAQKFYDAADVSYQQWLKSATTNGGMSESDAVDLFDRFIKAIQNKEM